MSGKEPEKNREQWSSKIGFILAAAGSAVGLGNIWRFPYLTGENGGASFVFVYILAAILLVLPLMWAELAFGRYTQKNMIGGILQVRPGTGWVIPGIFAFFVSFIVLSYYSVIAGWTIGYIYISLTQAEISFGSFISNLNYVLPLFAIFMFLTVWIVQAGIKKGIERWCSLLMPLLFFLCLAIAIRSLTLPNAMAGVKYYLVPDFAKINSRVIMDAVAQAFFSLSVGAGLMVVYGSYMSKQQSILKCSISVAIADTSIALLAGFMIFPAVFSFGKSPAAGPTLTFQVLPEIFKAMPGGSLVGACFFLLLLIAALTSSISLLEVPVAYFVDEKKWSRKFSAWLLGILAFFIGIPSALSLGANEWLTNMQFMGKTSFLDIADHIFGTLGFVTTSLLFCLFLGWKYDVKIVAEELNEGNPAFKAKAFLGLTLFKAWVFFMKIIAPVVLISLLLNRIGLDDNPIRTGIIVFALLLTAHFIFLKNSKKS
ncbi:MAG: sodium-dependent transporter [Candidatus Brocadiae bacterium]|nr:sodium-dependent transporter [Candidatus Brocadiia bacterium]